MAHGGIGLGGVRGVGTLLDAFLLGLVLAGCGVLSDDTSTVALAESEESIKVGAENVDPLALQFTRPHDRRQFRPAKLAGAAGFYLDPDGAVRRGEAGVEPPTGAE